MPEESEILDPWSVLADSKPAALKSDPGLPGKILDKVDDWILREAEHRVEEVIQKPSPCYVGVLWASECWEFLLGVRGLPIGCHDLFRAAASMCRAHDHLLRMMGGLATLNCDPVAELQRCDSLEEEQAKAFERRLFRSLYVKGRLHDALDSSSTNHSLTAELVALRRDTERNIVKHRGRKGLQPSPPAVQNYKLEQLMVFAWLRWGSRGLPGLCFYSEKALAELLDIVCATKEVGYARFKKTRQRLNLGFAHWGRDRRKPKVTSAKEIPNTPRIEITVKNDGRLEKLRLDNPSRLAPFA